MGCSASKTKTMVPKASNKKATAPESKPTRSLTKEPPKSAPVSKNSVNVEKSEAVETRRRSDKTKSKNDIDTAGYLALTHVEKREKEARMISFHSSDDDYSDFDSSSSSESDVSCDDDSSDESA